MWEPVGSGFRSASDRSVRAAYDAASAPITAARAPSVDDWSDDPMAPADGMAGSATALCPQVSAIGVLATAAMWTFLYGSSDTHRRNRICPQAPHEGNKGAVKAQQWLRSVPCWRDGDTWCPVADFDAAFGPREWG